MIRFFDKEVYGICLETESFKRSELLSFFLRGNREAIICLHDNHGAYCGRITYYSLLSNEDITGAILGEHVVLDEHIWKNGRKFFRDNAYGFEEFPILPVVDKDHRLLCFAYQDEEANRELRMLEEMEEMDDLIDFHDIFSEYECVTIEGFNELAYYFAKYLRNKEIPVIAKGEFWSEFDIGDIYEGLDYKNFVIYAEGTDQKSQALQERILHSVSVEFECINLIYEENYKNGRIKDALGDFPDLWCKIKESKNIVILGTGNKEQEVYDFLLENGVDIFCFVGKSQGHTGQLKKPILSKKEVFSLVENPIFIQCESANSAWSVEADEYAYRGYKRNQQYFLFRDYAQVPSGCLGNILEGNDIVLVGDIFLCKWLNAYFNSHMKNKVNHVSYCDVLEEEKVFPQQAWVKLKRRKKEEIKDTDIILLVAQKGIVNSTDLDQNKTVMQVYLEVLEKLNIKNYSDYFSNHSIILTLDSEKTKYSLEAYKPAKIMLGSVDACSGNVLFRHILDGHPNVLMMDWSYLNDNLDDFCIRLAQEKAENIFQLFCALYKKDAIYDNQPDPKRWQKFCESFKELLSIKEKFTSQELFVLFHVACAKSWGIAISDLSRTVIYWDPHCVLRGENFDNFARWLSDEDVQGITFRMVRNYYIKAGSFLRWWESEKRFTDQPVYGTEMISMFYTLFGWAEADASGVLIKNWERITIRFEDLKCQPRENLNRICELLQIPWFDTLLETTERGKEASFGGTTGFDLTPVYNLYEQYFSVLDRMKLSLLAAPWQKKYGYPYENCLTFSKKELQQLFLMKFRVEEMIHFIDEKELMTFRLYIKKSANYLLQKNRRLQIMETNR